LLTLSLLLSSFRLANPEKKEKDGFISLFNGKDLSLASHWELASPKRRILTHSTQI
jgi:hypothetical protein